ncbi:MAG TPA: TRAP transporter small permease, partial [Xanthobacteraceae bacterium]|nr:TRAP transporter small permease [Xanthobacteraceae bacterium]
MADAKPLSRRRQIEEFIFVRVPYVLSGTLFLMAVVLNIVNVIGRYVFGMPVFWAEEALTFTVIWIVFLVVGTITYRGAHLNMDLLYSRMPSVMQLVIRIAIALTLIVCAAYTAMLSWSVVKLHYMTSGVTAGTNIPLVIPHSALLFGFSFIAAAALVRLPSYISGK